MSQVKILVPTNFTPISNNAIDYAIGLANALNGELILVHQIIYKEASFINGAEVEAENTRRYNLATVQLRETQQYVKGKNANLITKTFLNTGPLEYIIEEVVKSPIDFIVIGTPGHTSLKSVILGSYTADVISNSKCPVFTIPPAFKFKKIEHILCATDFHKSELHSIHKLIHLSASFNASITICNVNPDKEKQKLKFEKFQTRIKEIAGNEHLAYFFSNSSEVVHSIEEYVNQKKPDIIVTLGKKRQLFDNIFGKHVTKKLSLHTHIPLLSFPASEVD